MDTVNIQVIARMQSDFATKFGIPRQSGLVEALRSTIVFEPEFRNSDALRGIEDFSHLWLIWQFSEAVRQGWSPTVRPPRLGGNTRMGVFATRSPFRPNNLGLSSVRLLGVEQTREFGTVLHVGGADLMDGTEDLLLVTAAGILIRTPVENIRVAGRATQGVIVMRFKEEGDRVISLALADPEEKEQPASEEAPL